MVQEQTVHAIHQNIDSVQVQHEYVVNKCFPQNSKPPNHGLEVEAILMGGNKNIINHGRRTIEPNG